MLSPLRNSTRRLSEPFGKAGLTVAVIALVMALVGGAYAAGTLNSKQKKEVEKIAKKYAGKPGATGPAGSAGPTGPGGANGSNGSNGTNGLSVTSEEFGPTGKDKKCVGRGGTKLTSASGSTYVCNGEEGEEGEPWSAGGTLPNGATETGVWSMGTPKKGSQLIPISFTIPLASTPEAIFVGPTEASKPGCPGRGGADGGDSETFPLTGIYRPTVPRAAPGKLCVYANALYESSFEFFVSSLYYEELGFFPEYRSGEDGAGVSPAGTTLQMLCEEEFCFSLGTWAVTGS